MTTATPPRWTEYQPVAGLQPAARNAKDHDQAALAASVGEFGFVEPVVLDERTGRLVAGHGRAEYLQELEAAGGGPPPDGVVVDDEGRWLVLVTRGWASRDDAHAEAAGIALNRVGERGGWRTDVLSEALDALAAVNLLDAAGFTAADLDLLIAETQAAAAGVTDPTDAWAGMPEFDQRDRSGAFATTIHFQTREDAERFWTEVFNESPKRHAWWPKSDGWVGSDQSQAYVAEA